MKTNAITRIIIWSIVLVLLVGLLGVGLYRPGRRSPANAAAATEAPVREAPAMPVEEEYLNITAVISATQVNVRTAPASFSTVIGTLDHGTTILVGRSDFSENEEWFWISEPVTGWIKAEYAELTEPIASSETSPFVLKEEAASVSSATVTDTLNIRSAPNGDSSVLGVLHKGESVTITRQETINNESWAYITSPSAGWVKAEFLSLESSRPTVSGQSWSFDPRQIREIDIEWAAGSIIVEPADVDTIQVSETNDGDSEHIIVCRQSNDKLIIRYSEQSVVDFSFGVTLNDVESKDLIIQVPVGWEFDSLEVDAASANVDINNLAINEVDFNGASGTCNLENCVIGELDIDTASGDIYFTGSLDMLDCDAASATVYAVFDNVPERIDMDSMSGDLDITLPGDAGFAVSMDALSSDFVCEFGYSENREGYYRGDGKCKITLDAMSGDLYIREHKEADAIAETTP